MVLTAFVLATGVTLMFVGPGGRLTMLFLHKASFVLWFGAMTVHVLGHLVDTSRLAARDWFGRARRDVGGGGPPPVGDRRQRGAGVLLGTVVVGRVGPWLASTPHIGH